MTKTYTRMTKQRKVLLEELRRMSCHPTAYELYERVRERMPQISLGTVYRNLEILSSSGTILKLDMAKGQRRFDATTDDHAHIRCVSCGRIDDLPLNALPDPATIMGIAGDASGYDVLGCDLDFHGICPACRQEGINVPYADKQLEKREITK